MKFNKKWFLFVLPMVCLNSYVGDLLPFGSKGKAYAVEESTVKKEADKPKESGGIFSFFKGESKSDTNAANQFTANRPPKNNTGVMIPATFAPILQPVLPGVVNVATIQLVESPPMSIQLELPKPFSDNPMFKEFIEQFSQSRPEPQRVPAFGTGFIVQSDANKTYVVTNHHVVADAKKVKIILPDETEMDAKVHGLDPKTDLAVLEIDAKNIPMDNKVLPTLKWGSSNDLNVGDWVIAIGNAFKLGHTVTAGIVSYRARDVAKLEEVIQHSAPINFGNSGGPLIDINGTVVAINTAIYTPSGGNVGVGFAIPEAIARPLIEQLIKNKKTSRGWIGVHISPFSKEAFESIGVPSKDNACVVASVNPGGPADKAGLKVDDIIVGVNGEGLKNKKLTRIIGSTTVGKEIVLNVVRKGKEMSLKVIVGDYDKALKAGDITNQDESQKPQHAEFLGLDLTPVSDELRKSLNLDPSTKGLAILKVNPNSKAAEVEIMPKDIILSVNQEPVATLDDFERIISKAKKSGRRHVLLLLNRQKVSFYVALKMDDDFNSNKG